MRKETCIHTFNKSILLLSICFLFLVSTILCSLVQAQDENELRIFLYEYSDGQSSTIPMNSNLFLENHEYGVLVVYNKTNEYGETRPEVAYGVRITVPWGSYLTSVNAPEIEIEAPRFEDYREFVITASKPSFADAEKVITVIKGTLSMIIDRGTVEEGRSFQVMIQDQNDGAVENCLVYIQAANGQLGDSDLTDLGGVVYLSAPQIQNGSEGVSVVSYKDGYIGNVTEIRVEDVPLVMIAADLYSILPIVIAVVVVIIAMVIVRMKKNALYPKMVQEVEEEKHDTIPQVEKRKFFSSRSKKSKKLIIEEPKSIEMNLPAKDDPRIEEIRIPASNKRKETMYIMAEKEPTPSPRNNKKPEDQIIEGTDELRYTIDKITGKIDEKKKDRWFEGTTDIRKKVDEAISKKYKKKKEK